MRVLCGASMLDMKVTAMQRTQRSIETCLSLVCLLAGCTVHSYSAHVEAHTGSSSAANDAHSPASHASHAHHDNAKHDDGDKHADHEPAREPANDAHANDARPTPE